MISLTVKTFKVRIEIAFPSKMYQSPKLLESFKALPIIKKKERKRFSLRLRNSRKIKNPE
jgi:hypothetical protein